MKASQFTQRKTKPAVSVLMSLQNSQVVPGNILYGAIRLQWQTATQQSFKYVKVEVYILPKPFTQISVSSDMMVLGGPLNATA